jgi:hypothetical protein
MAESDADVDVGQAAGESPPGRVEVSWIVLHPDLNAVLVVQGSPSLPSTEVPGETWLGDAPVLTGALAEIGLDAVLLGCHDLVEDPQSRVQHLTMVATPRPGAVTAPPGTRWAGLDEVSSLVPSAIRVVRAGRPPWEAPDWFPATEGWLRERLARMGRPVTGRVEQRRSWELSSLLRAPTQQGPVWLKASSGSSLFTDEGAVMAVLADWFPEQVPAPLGWDQHRRLVLLDEFGPRLGSEAPIEVQEQVLIDYARLQAATADRLDALDAVRLPDRGPTQLARQIAAWLADLNSTAQLPGLDPHTWLTAAESATLCTAIPSLLDLCDALTTGPIPLTLLHGYLHMNNVAAGPCGPVLFDWTDACTGHPFFDLITVLHGPIPPAGPRQSPPNVGLRDAYLSGWADHGSPGQLADAWRAAEVVGAMHHALSYRAIAEACAPPVDLDMGSATAGWLRSAIAALQTLDLLGNR